MNEASRRPGDVLICGPKDCFYVPPSVAADAAAAVNLGRPDITTNNGTVEDLGKGISAGGLALSAGGVASGYAPAIVAGGALQVGGAALEFFGRPNPSSALSLATELATDRITAVRFGAGIGLGVSALRFGVSALPVRTPPQLSELNVP